MVLPINMNHNITYSPGTFSKTSTPPSLAAKYKLLTTGGNDPHISNKMKYANFAKNSVAFSRYPILTLKEPPTGLAQVVTQANVKYQYLGNNTNYQLLSKIYCIQYH